ncbi:hypothetical protein [Streptomyces marianii]|uniref:hypothetical protein n=1 Tax=Streptomyces marianii TaxID=1817406 RepID=UPI001485D647|nr:hypothetical protein [Streptomyces marianii]
MPFETALPDVAEGTRLAFTPTGYESRTTCGTGVGIELPLGAVPSRPPVGGDLP